MPCVILLLCSTACLTFFSVSSPKNRKRRTMLVERTKSCNNNASNKYSKNHLNKQCPREVQRRRTKNSLSRPWTVQVQVHDLGQYIKIVKYLFRSSSNPTISNLETGQLQTTNLFTSSSNHIFSNLDIGLLRTTMAVVLPKTYFQLLKSCTLEIDDQNLTGCGKCQICMESYSTSFNGEYPIKLPGCRHIFGERCISSWLEKNQTTCPICGEPILDTSGNPHRRITNENRLYLQPLLDGHPAVGDDPYAPTVFALRGDQLFRELCEAIVCAIEAPSIVQRTYPVEEWLAGRAAFMKIVKLGTFKRFVADGVEHEDHLVHRLPELLSNQRPLTLIMEHFDQYPEANRKNGLGLLEEDENTFEQLSIWYQRVTKIRQRLHQRLYEARSYEHLFGPW